MLTVLVLNNSTHSCSWLSVASASHLLVMAVRRPLRRPCSALLRPRNALNGSSDGPRDRREPHPGGAPHGRWCCPIRASPWRPDGASRPSRSSRFCVRSARPAGDPLLQLLGSPRRGTREIRGGHLPWVGRHQGHAAENDSWLRMMTRYHCLDSRWYSFANGCWWWMLVMMFEEG